jgi:SnoaL-like domain
MALTAEDRTAITELLSMHGHLVDAGELDRLHELFTDDVTYDVTDLGAGSLEGLAAIREAALALGELNPVGHHVTNIVLTELADDQVRALSKGIGINADGTSGSVTYEDTISRGDQGWRISYRKAAGGKLHGYWYAFGDHDGMSWARRPTTPRWRALVTVAGSGAFSSLSTTVLVTVEEMLDALGRAQRIACRPPGG